MEIDDGYRVPDTRTDILRQPHTYCELTGTGLQLAEISADGLVGKFGEILVGVAADRNPLDAAIETDRQRLFDQRARIDHSRCCANFLEDVLPIVHPAAIGLHYGVAVEPNNLVEQFGAKAVHHAHHHDQHRHRQHHHADGDAGNEGDESLALARKQVAFGDRPFERREDQGSPCLCLREATRLGRATLLRNEIVRGSVGLIALPL